MRAITDRINAERERHIKTAVTVTVTVTENRETGEVKLKILRKDAMYVPREVLQVRLHD